MDEVCFFGTLSHILVKAITDSDQKYAFMTLQNPQPWSLEKIRTIEKQGLEAGLPLMQHAADCALKLILKCHGLPQHALVLAGPGNNGGDALTLALGLWQRGSLITVIQPQLPKPAVTDAYAAHTNWIATGGSVLSQWPDEPNNYDLIIDGLFGIGLDRPLTAPWQHLIECANRHEAPTLALDIPSGLFAQSTSTPNPQDPQNPQTIIQACWTTAFIAPTQAVCEARHAHWVGELHLCDLGLRSDA